MTPVFDTALVESHDLFHARYGPGAVIVAIPRDPDAEADGKRSSRGLHVARLFSARFPGETGSAPDFQRITAIEEQSGFVRITLQFEYRSQRRPQDILASAVIDRVIPIDRVTLEIVRAAER